MEKRVKREIKSKTSAKKNKRMILLIVFLCCLTIISSAAIFATFYVCEKLDKIVIVETPKDDKEWGIIQGTPTALDDYQNVAILGVDSYQLPGDKFSGTRTDAILIASINKKTGDVKFLSVMRDSYLQVQTSDGDFVYAKINNAHAYGGPLDTCVSLNRNLDLNINEFIVINWKTVADMVDILGGIDVDISEDELYDLKHAGLTTSRALGQPYTPITEIGIQHLDGVQAVAYCRIRKTSGGDGARTERSREALTAIIKEAKKMDFGQLERIADEILPGVRTNIAKQNMLKYIINIRSYKIGDSILFPVNYRGGLVGEGWYAVPRDLEYNVQEIHKFLFAQEQYVLSDVAKGISDEIIQRTGFGL